MARMAEPGEPEPEPEPGVLHPTWRILCFRRASDWVLSQAIFSPRPSHLIAPSTYTYLPRTAFLLIYLFIYYLCSIALPYLHAVLIHQIAFLSPSLLIIITLHSRLAVAFW